MNHFLARSVVAASMLFVCGVAADADEAAFLQSLEGNWSGNGTVRVRADTPPMNVSCRFESDTTASSLSLDGRCTALAVFSRAISADLRTDGDSYSGSYIGAGTGTAGLGGQRVGDAINLGIRWAKEVNGDRKAQMTVEKVGASGMRLTTVDAHPVTGKSIVTSRIDLRRS